MRGTSTFAPPADAVRVRGPLRALEEAVDLLAPFNYTPKKRPGLDASEMLSIDPEILARALVENLAEHLNALLFRARHAPRSRQIKTNLRRLRKKLLDICGELGALDDWSRFHLTSPVGPQLRPGVLPPIVEDGRGEFAETAATIASKVQSVLLNLPPDLGGRRKHDEHLLGSAKLRFIREAFELFDAYHPGQATSSDGTPFLIFVHKVYEYATRVHDENRAGLEGKFRSHIKSLHAYKKADEGYWATEMKIIALATDDPNLAKLQQQKKRFSKRKEDLELGFVPALKRAGKRQPRKKSKR